MEEGDEMDKRTRTEEFLVRINPPAPYVSYITHSDYILQNSDNVPDMICILFHNIYGLFNSVFCSSPHLGPTLTKTTATKKTLF